MSESSGPGFVPPSDGAFDAAMRAGFARSAPSDSVLAKLATSGGPAVALLLREEGSDGAPIVHAPAVDIPPREEGRYQMLGEIARGGVGVVFKGRDADLGRDVAMKVLRDEYAERPEVVARFVEEAQIGGQLQHPGIVPVYELGLRGDRRPFFTMKLIKGKTLSLLLQERPDPSHERQRFLSIFEMVCQTVAYAHSRGVIHRDLKPANVMVGAFGEVQVVDWGLAKVLPRGGVADERAAAAAAAGDASVVATIRSGPGGSGSGSEVGSVMGTPPYMPPEQARGDVASGDERSDVFSLGAVLCEVLTGRPPYVGDAQEVYLKAVRADLDDARARLAACGADQPLIDLANACLKPSRAERPADAGVVARSVGTYQASVEERARAAQLAAAEAKVKAAEEKRARKLTVALAAAVLAVVLVGGGSYLSVQREHAARVAAANRRVETALAEASLRRGHAASAKDMLAWNAALSASREADALARSTDADDGVREKAASLLSDVEGEASRAKAEADRLEGNRRMEGRLEEARAEAADDDRRAPAAADAAYAAAFRDFGIDVDRLPTEEAKARLLETGIAVTLALALDDWARVRREARKASSEDDARLERLAKAVDPDPWRMQLRDATDLATLRELAASADTAGAPFESLVRLGSALGAAGDKEGAVALLRAAWPRHPEDFWVNYEMARWIRKRGEPARAEPYFRASLALRPRSGTVRILWALDLQGGGDAPGARVMLESAVALNPTDGHIRAHLASVMNDLGKFDEAYEIAKEAVRLSSDDMYCRSTLGACLRRRGDNVAAVAEFREVVRLAPEAPSAYAGLSQMLMLTGDLEGALAAAKEGIRVGPQKAPGHLALGRVHWIRREMADAESELREAFRLDPDDFNTGMFLARFLVTRGERKGACIVARELTRRHPGIAASHNVLAEALDPATERAEAIAELRESIRLDASSLPAAWSHVNLGVLLNDAGDFDAAAAEDREAIRISPDLAEAHCNLGMCLQKQGRFPEALAELRSGHAFGSRRKGWPYPSGDWVKQAERMVDLDPRLPALLRGEGQPAGAREAADFGHLCSVKRLYGASARFYVLAYGPDGTPGEGIEVSERYNAVCSLAVAGAGGGTDAASFDEAARAAWRSLALAMLRAELAEFVRRIENPTLPGPAPAAKLTRWKTDPDLRGIRDAEALERMPEAERSSWRALWAEVEEVLARQGPDR